MAEQKKKEQVQEAKSKALELALAQIEKQFGKGSIMKLGQDVKVDVPIISTGALSLDLALGIGGLPRGRVVEIFGPEASGKTTLTLTVIREAQRRGGVAAFIDAEHAFDYAYAKKIGLNLDDLLISQPDTGEQALEIAETLVRSNAVDVIGIDSVAALVPRAEIEGEMGASHMGLQARLMSQALRKLTAAISKSKTCVIFINQIRMKIGVMFGCFHYTTRVILANGKTEKIGKIVNQRLPLEVLSYDSKTGVVRPKRIIGWFDNGRTERFLQFKVANNTRDGRASFGCTFNHLILSERGWVRAGQLRVGERLAVAIKDSLSKEQLEVVRGSILGDGNLRRVGRFNTQLRIGHGHRQDAYAKWKQSLFKGLVGSQYQNSKGGCSFDTIPLYELTQLVEQNYSQKGKDHSVKFIKELTPLAIAIWYMDDGTFDKERKNRCSICCKSISKEKRLFLAEKFKEWGIEASFVGNGHINFGVETTKKLHSLISSYVHPSMAYKLMPKFQGRFAGLKIKTKITERVVYMPILEIYDKPVSKNTHRFDLQIEDDHTYLVDGVVVHNSPETTPGGRALKFYSSVRLDLRRLAQIKVGEQIIGNRVRAKVVKNKVAPPFRKAEFDILYDQGISKSSCILEIAVEHNILQKSGAWFIYGQDKIGQGKENARRFLEENPKLLKELETKIREKISV